MKRSFFITCAAVILLGAVIYLLIIKNNESSDYYPLSIGNEWKYLNKENGKNVYTTKLKIIKENRGTFEIKHIRSSYTDDLGFKHDFDTSYYYAKRLNDGSIKSWNKPDDKIEYIKLVEPYAVPQKLDKKIG